MPPPELARSTSADQSESNASVPAPEHLSNAPSVQAPSLTIPSVEVRALRPHRTLAAVIGALFAVGAFFIAALVLIVSRANSEPAASVEEIDTTDPADSPLPAVAPGADTPGAAEKEPADKKVKVRIKVSPKSATLTLDGKPLEGNPFNGELPADGREHELVVSAEGYDDETRQLLLSTDKELEIVLKRTRSGTFRPSKPAPNSEEDFPDLKGGKGGKTAAPLDTEDPW
jgi:hypothetical protein